MRPKLALGALVVLALSANALAQSSGTWQAAAGQSTSSVHSGVAGGKHEHVDVAKNVQAGGSDTVTLTIVHFVPNGDGTFHEETFTTTIPVGEHRSFHGDVKSVVVTAGQKNAKGTYAVTYP